MCVMWLHVCTLRSRIFYYQCIMYAAKLDTWYVGYCQQLLVRPVSKRVERMFSRSKVSRSIDRSQEFFSRIKNENMSSINDFMHWMHGLRTPREEIAFTARPKIQSQPQILRYDWSIFCLPHRPNFLCIFELCLSWVSVVRQWNLEF